MKASCVKTVAKRSKNQTGGLYPQALAEMSACLLPVEKPAGYPGAATMAGNLSRFIHSHTQPAIEQFPFRNPRCSIDFCLAKHRSFADG